MAFLAGGFQLADAAPDDGFAAAIVPVNAPEHCKRLKTGCLEWHSSPLQLASSRPAHQSQSRVHEAHPIAAAIQAVLWLIAGFEYSS